MEIFVQILAGVAVLLITIGLLAGCGYWVQSWRKRKSLQTILLRHFRPATFDSLAITERQFPFHIRADVQWAVEEFIRQADGAKLVGVRSSSRYESLDFAALLGESSDASATVGPPQYDQIDVGSDEPVQALQNGLWLIGRGGTKAALLYQSSIEFGSCGAELRVKVQVATANNAAGNQLTNDFFRSVESAVGKARCYRGKILSLEAESSYLGHATGIKVHRLGKLDRDQVILPAKTLELLDRNVIGFVTNRHRLGRLAMATKKGLLFYGPPGTGKTHTIRYLAGLLPGHTTLLISAEQVARLSQYLTLARLLQPSLVVIEDVDLIARERTQMRDGTTEVLLNKLLNEMDGLKEDCEILFVLTTNRPEDLEAALASRPGRIDQAIEFPLPDEAGRAKLVRLYARGLVVSDELVAAIVDRTKHVSASFIKELMRRSAQFHLAANGTDELTLSDVEMALDEMVFTGGSLNMKLLGAETWSRDD